ncbi:hypothetical protein GCM10028822_12800 [Hymenobacter terrigena]
MKELKWSKWLLSIGILCVITAPFVLTRSFGLFSFNETGPIGDTIGGITSPITSLIGSVLVFFALKAQIDANELVRQQFEQQQLDEIQRKVLTHLTEQVNLIRNDINDFGFVHERTDNNLAAVVIPYKGASAFTAFVELLPDLLSSDSIRQNPFEALPTLASLKALLEMIDNILNSIRKASLSEEDKNFLTGVIAYQYTSKIKPAFSAKLHQFKTMPLHFNIRPIPGNSESVFSDSLYNLVLEIDKKIGVEKI